jgi:hypothetical protein
MFVSVGTLSFKNLGIEIFDRLSGFKVEWGPPYQAIALMLAGWTLFTQLLECRAPEPPPDSDADTEKPKYQAGIYEPMKAITSRSPFLVLALVALQQAPTPKPDIPDEEPSWSFLSTFSVACFLPCVAAMTIQIIALLTFVCLKSDSTAEAKVDSMGTLAVEPENQGAQAMVRNLRSAASTLMIFGLILGFLSMGILPWIPIKLGFFLFVFPFLPATGKEAVKEVVVMKKLMLIECAGAVGEKIEAHLAKRQERAAAASEKKAAEMLDAEEEARGRTKNKGDPNELKKKQPNPSAKKAAVGGKKKKTM